jgi:hypothetical protein
MRRLFSRKELEHKAQKISESSNLNIRVSKLNGELSIELADDNMENKRIFNGDIEECSIFVDGLTACLQVIGDCKV